MRVILFVFAAGLLQLAASSPVSHHKQLTPEEVARLAAWTPEDQNMWQLSGQFEGDIVLAPSHRNGIIDPVSHWPNREIPYVFADGDFTDGEKRFITQSLEGEYGKTCVTVRPAESTDVDFVYITGEYTGCWSSVGHLGGNQTLNLQPLGCMTRSTVAHEFLHAAGFYHQQSAHNRDDYVTIMWENILDGQQHNFDKYDSDTVTSFGEEYDYASVVHYDGKAFTWNGEPTIVPKDPNAVIGVRRGLSALDVIKLNKMYNCE